MTAVARISTGSRQSRLRAIAFDLLRRPVLVGSALFLIIVAVAAMAAPWIAPYDPYAGNLMKRGAGYSAQHWLGTDEQGRDILSRIIFGTRITLGASLLSMLFGGGVGTLAGIVAAYVPRLDAPIMRLADVLLSFPAVLIGMSVAAIAGPGLATIVIALSISTVPAMARIARSAALGVVSQEYMTAGRAMGLSHRILLLRYVLKNSASTIITFATQQFAHVVILVAGLSFLGLGVRPPLAELGSMIGQGRSLLFIAPHVSLVPCAAIFVIVLAVNLLGDELRDYLDPKAGH